jgi:ATP-dependent Clp protease ATP-binding subunit ClpA
MTLSKESKGKNDDSLIQKSNVQSKKVKEYDEGGYKSNKAKKYKDNYRPTYYHQPEYYQPTYYQNESQYYNSSNYQNNEHTNYVNKLPTNDYINNNAQLKRKQIKKKFVYLLLEIETIEDLIQLGNDYGVKYSKDNDYNIDLEVISNLVEPLTEFNKLVGLKNIKKQIVEIILYYTLKLDVKNQDLLHTVIEGEPGTGKTELAEGLAKIYVNLGILSKNIFLKVKVSDLKGQYLGHSAAMTEEILEECKGGVLFIDEAYSLGNAEGKNSKDVYSKEILDLLNLALTENKNDFICIIAGYKDDLKNSFFSFNDGLERRFPIRFSIEPYNGLELKQIFIKKVHELNWNITDDAIDENFIDKNRHYFKFNGGDMEVLLTKCKIAHSKNLLKFKDKIKKLLTKEDIDYGFKIYLENPSISDRNNLNDNKNHINMYL